MSIQPPPSREKLPVVNGWAEMPRAWIKYFNELASQVGTAAGTAWANVSKSGSSLADIETRNHSDLQNLNTADHAHMRLADRDALVGGDDTTLHYHSADRNLTGSPTQTFSVAAATAATHAVNRGQMSGPAFRAYKNANQTGITDATWVKVIIDTEVFDTATNFDATTNSRFTPDVAGYYAVNGKVSIGGVDVVSALCAIYKNGAQSLIGSGVVTGVAMSGEIHSNVMDVLYLNGTTDYVELWVYINATSGNLVYGGAAQTNFSGYLARLPNV